MPDYTKAKNVHTFLLAKFGNDEAFTKAELRKVSGWPDSSFNTYWSKQFRPLLLETEEGFRVAEVFRKFTDWKQFQSHVTQVRLPRSEFAAASHDHVLLFEFFMPLTNEGHLRTTLDALFYEDTIRGKLKAEGLTKVEKRFPRLPKENQSAYSDRLLAWIGNRFRGYSIGQVDGRFRSGPLRTIGGAAEIFKRKAGRYLIDETTAIVRFIFPCGNPRRNGFHTDEHDYEADPDTLVEASQLRFFFDLLFVRSIVEFVNREEEIWLLESGMRTRLHIWACEEECS